MASSGPVTKPTFRIASLIKSFNMTSVHPVPITLPTNNSRCSLGPTDVMGAGNAIILDNKEDNALFCKFIMCFCVSAEIAVATGAAENPRDRRGLVSGAGTSDDDEEEEDEDEEEDDDAFSVFNSCSSGSVHAIFVPLLSSSTSDNGRFFVSSFSSAMVACCYKGVGVERNTVKGACQLVPKPYGNSIVCDGMPLWDLCVSPRWLPLTHTYRHT